MWLRVRNIAIGFALLFSAGGAHAQVQSPVSNPTVFTIGGQLITTANANGSMAPGYQNVDSANLSALSGCVAKVIQPISANGAQCELIVVGDSVDDGTNATSVGTNSKAGSWPSQLVAQLNSLGIPASDDNWIGSDNKSSAFDSRFTIGAGWGGDATGLCPGQSCFVNTTTTNGLVYAPNIRTNTSVVYYIKVAGNTTFTLCDEASTCVTASQSGAASVGSVTLTDGSVGFHTYTIAKTAAGGTTDVMAMFTRDTNTPRVEIASAGSSGSCASGAAGTCTTNYWDNTTNPYSPESALCSLGANGFFLGLGANDAAQGNTSAQFQTSFTNLINTMKGCGFAIARTVIPIRTSVITQATQNVFNSAIRNATFSGSVPLVDINEQWVSYTQATSDGKMNANDNHPQSVGYGAMASSYGVLFAAVSARGGGNGFFNNGTVALSNLNVAAITVGKATPVGGAGAAFAALTNTANDGEIAIRDSNSGGRATFQAQSDTTTNVLECGWNNSARGAYGALVAASPFCYANGTALIVMDDTSPIEFAAGSNAESQRFTSTAIIQPTANVLGFGASGTADTALSRDAAGVVDVGNGTQGNKSGTINVAVGSAVNTTTSADAKFTTANDNATGSVSIFTRGSAGSSYGAISASTPALYANGNPLVIMSDNQPLIFAAGSAAPGEIARVNSTGVVMASGKKITFESSATGAGVQTFTNSPCTGLSTERWIPVTITGQTGTWNIPACQ